MPGAPATDAYRFSSGRAQHDSFSHKQSRQSPTARAIASGALHSPRRRGACDCSRPRAIATPSPTPLLQWTTNDSQQQTHGAPPLGRGAANARGSSAGQPVAGAQTGASRRTATAFSGRGRGLGTNARLDEPPSMGKPRIAGLLEAAEGDSNPRPSAWQAVAHETG